VIARILRVVRGVRRACNAVEGVLDKNLRVETTEDAEIARRVAAEARAARLEQELRCAEDRAASWERAAKDIASGSDARGQTIWRLQNRLTRLRRHLRRAQATTQERADELRRARDELERVAESADARDEMRRRQAN